MENPSFPVGKPFLLNLEKFPLPVFPGNLLKRIKTSDRGFNPEIKKTKNDKCHKKN